MNSQGENVNNEQMEKSKSLLGDETVNMLLQTHQDAIWILENLGVCCKQPEIQDAYKKFEADGLAFLYENRIFVTPALVKECLNNVPSVSDFFVPMNSFFIGGTAPYIYDDKSGKGGIIPTPDDVIRIAQTAEKNNVVSGMGRGVKLKDEVQQMNIMDKNCNKPLYFAVGFVVELLSLSSFPSGFTC